jgi:hypothetical protein
MGMEFVAISHIMYTMHILATALCIFHCYSNVLREISHTKTYDIILEREITFNFLKLDYNNGICRLMAFESRTFIVLLYILTSVCCI